MPLIKPHIIDADNLTGAIHDVLVDSGVTPAATAKQNKLDNIRQTFDNAGASIHAVAAEVAYSLSNGDSSNSRLKAAELILKVQGVLQEIDEKQIPQITININGTDNQTLINLVLPTI